MKVLNKIFALGLIAVASFVGCDEVEDPYAHLDEFISETGDVRFNDTIFNDTTLSTRGILLEDFTGHTCPNCPIAQDESKKLIEDNPGVVWAVAIHAGNFAEPDLPDFPADFRTNTGEDLRVKFRIASFPSGVINRSEWNGTIPQGHQLWENIVNTQKADAAYMTPRFKVRSTNIYNTESRIFRVIPEIEALSSVSGEIFFIIMLAENGIVSPQIDNRLPAPSKDKEYVHNHLLRKGFPADGGGRRIFTDPSQGDVYAVQADDATAEFRFKVEEEWAAENCEVLFLIINNDTDEILHVEGMPLMNTGG